ncbi:HopJ type III effector protein [Gayadomonas joobiniege]|uniref:HopJ type III effector protein n=1 Tax=Gayadomonas joobiniege TaxID=1234606 RepID=UPI000474AE68|nr:HopJ type III effector protein [Gayadomonas joobiniege]
MSLLPALLKQIKQNPASIQFKQVIEVIESEYVFTPQAFKNGDLENTAEQNQGSCKILSFAKLHQLNEAQTLHLFGDYYRQDVLQNPNGSDHQNIRNFMQTGWQGVDFSAVALQEK